MIKLQFTLRSMLFATFVCAAATWFVQRVGYPWQWFLGVLFGNNTVYSEGYTERGWGRMKVGMSEEEAVSILGAPLTKARGANQFTIWAYTSYMGDECYHLRELHLRSGIVRRKISRYERD